MMLTYRIVLRMRLPYRASLVEPYEFQLGSRTVTFSPSHSCFTDTDPVWASLSAAGFETESEARKFGARLSESCQVASVLECLGVLIEPGGPDTPGFYSAGAREMYDGQTVMRGMFRGLDIFADRPGILFTTNYSEGIFIKLDVKPFVEGVQRHFERSEELTVLGGEYESVLRLLNEALQIEDPIGRTVLLISIVEGLGQNERWSESQKSFIMGLRNITKQAALDEPGRVTELDEIEDALSKLHKLSLRQGVMRLLNRHGLSALRNDWETLYEKRSKVVHGSATSSYEQLSKMAMDATNLCGLILIAIMGNRLSPTIENLKRFYPTA